VRAGICAPRSRNDANNTSGRRESRATRRPSARHWTASTAPRTSSAGWRGVRCVTGRTGSYSRHGTWILFIVGARPVPANGVIGPVVSARSGSPSFGPSLPWVPTKIATTTVTRSTRGSAARCWPFPARHCPTGHAFVAHGAIPVRARPRVDVTQDEDRSAPARYRASYLDTTGTEK
jgi:hypothetical protein